MSLWDHVLWKSIGRKHGKSEGALFEEEKLGYPSNMSQCCLKVAKITHDHDTTCKGHSWPGWMKWFIIRNPNSTLRVVRGLEPCKSKGLCLENVASLHDNLCDMY
jgi:hypothetical protein